jgi:hypothetical protein
MYDFVVASNGITFIPSFVKIGQLVQKLKAEQTHRQHGYLISLLSFLKKESRLQLMIFTGVRLQEFFYKQHT